jgi:hypothetical protein
MNKEELLTVFSDVLKDKDILKTKGIHETNHRPHPYTVGPKHVQHAADNYGGIMGEATLEAIPCAHKGCALPYEDHDSDKVLFLQLTRNATEIEANDELIKIKDLLKEHGIDGVAFVDTEEKYRFLKDGDTKN